MTHYEPDQDTSRDQEMRAPVVRVERVHDAVRLEERSLHGLFAEQAEALSAETIDSAWLAAAPPACTKCQRISS
jgi:hypothetical protein